jgi:hypothetical protein
MPDSNNSVFDPGLAGRDSWRLKKVRSMNKPLEPSYQRTGGISGILPSGPSQEGETLQVRYDEPEQQLVDFYSRFGVWWSPDSPYFGIDRGAMASQREGKKCFMAPLARLGVLDIDTDERLFVDPENLAELRTSGYPWGLVQEGEAGSLRLRVTIAYAALDVIAVKVEVLNLQQSQRHLRLCLQARAIPEDRSRTVVFHAEAGEVITAQTSAPTSQFRIRPEPHIDIVTGWRMDFGITRRHAEGGGFSLEGDAFSLAPEERRAFSLYVSAASSDSDSADWLIPLVRQRLAAKVLPPDDAITSARRRWEEIFGSLPADKLDAKTRSLVHRAMMILVRNTIRPQPEQGYGQLMGPFRGTFPCRSSYEGFWVWDSAFQALGFAEWDLELAKDNIRLMLHNQDHEGGLPMLHPDAKVTGANPPLFSWVVMAIYEKERPVDAERAKAFLNEVYEKLVKWNRWWFRRRDKNGNGLAEWGDNLESGWDDSPRWDNADGQAGWDNDFGSTLYEAVDLNAYLIKDLRCLARMAEALNRVDENERWINEANELAHLVVDVLYDPQDNLFYDTHYATGERHKLLTPASLLPLWAGVPLPEDRVRAMIEAYLLAAEHFFGDYPFPTVSYKDPAHDASGQSGYWRGPIWLNIAYFMIEVLACHGYTEEAQRASRKILEMVRRAGIHENYDARTGERGVNSENDFSWSAAMTIATAMRQLPQASPPSRHRLSLAWSLHLGVHVRDRKIYGRGKEAWIHLANRAAQSLSGMLHFRLPKGWAALIHDPSAGPEEGWTTPMGLAFQLEPGATEERPIRFVLPDQLEESAYGIDIEAVTARGTSVRLARTVLRLENPSMAPLPWLTEETAIHFRDVFHAGAPFRFVHDGREIGQAAPGLVGLLNSRVQFLARQALAKHAAERDFIKHAYHLVKDVPGLAPLCAELESFLDPSMSWQAADEEARELLETLVQQTRDMTGG